MLLSIFPIANEPSAISPNEGALTLLAASFILAFVDLTIWPTHSPMAMKLVLRPLPGVLTPITPVIAALAVEDVLLELASVLWAMRPMKDAETALHTLRVAAPVPAAIRVCLGTLSVRCVICPLSLIDATIWPHHAAIAGGSRATPLTRVHIPILVTDGSSTSLHIADANAAILSRRDRVGVAAQQTLPHRDNLRSLGAAR
mmetsp:Transcript_40985/g.72068  ORF Transcript_40985/g.72068 Transcript_40985/m.72068 type:complete len:201 (-) Transcript_40985:121-723(-)